MCAERHNDLVDNDPLLVEAERHARALLREADVLDEDDSPIAEPYLIRTQAEIDGYPPFPFPNLCGNQLGDEGAEVQCPNGWVAERTLFCDSSGFGLVGEAALTPKQLKAELRPGFAYAVTGVGQFQVYVTEYKRSEG